MVRCCSWNDIQIARRGLGLLPRMAAVHLKVLCPNPLRILAYPLPTPSFTSSSAWARRANFWIFPEAVLGNVSAKKTYLGTIQSQSYERVQWRFHSLRWRLRCSRT